MTAEQAAPTVDALPLPAVERQTGESPKCAIIWLHGLGADGHDFEPIVDEFDLDQLPAVRFVFPHAPMRAVTINGGFVMRAWYDIVSPDFAPGREEVEGVRESARQIEVLIAQENARGIPDARIILAGFSQGGVIALHTGLRHPQRLAGILALSCYLPMTETLAAEASAANRDVPIFMAHGQNDAVIPYDLGKRTAKLLKAEKYPVQWHSYAAEHTVCLEELQDIETWVHQVLASAC